MSALQFLSPGACDPGVVLQSPLRRALEGVDPEQIRDLSHLGKIEVEADAARIDVPALGVIPVGPGRALIVCSPAETAALLVDLGGRYRVFDMSAAYAALEIRGEALLRRLSRLDPASLPAVGSFARVRGIVARGEGDAFLVFVAQEHGHFVCEFVLDALEGIDH